MITKRDVLERFAREWRNLAAWGASLPMRIEIKDYKGTQRLGAAKSYECRAWVYDTGDLAGNLKTILHEMAHLAAPSQEHHGKAWRTMYARAASEALGAPIDRFDMHLAHEILDDQVRDAVITWLDRSGQTVVLKALGVL